MSVAGARDILGRGAEFFGQRRFGDQRSSIRTDDVHSEHPVGSIFREDFDETLSIAIGPGARIGGEWELACAVFDRSRLEFLLGFPD